MQPPRDPSYPDDLVESVSRELERGERSDDAFRVRLLEDLYRSLEAELDRDVENGSSRR